MKMWTLLRLRLAVFALLFLVEWSPVSNFLRTGLGLRHWLELAVFCASFFVAVTYSQARHSQKELAGPLAECGIGWGFLAFHFCALAGLVLLAGLGLPETLHLAGIVAFGSLTLATSVFAFFPPRFLYRLIGGTGRAGWYALALALAAWPILRFFWSTALGGWRQGAEPFGVLFTQLTFDLVRGMLQLFLPVVTADRARAIIGGSGFAVRIDPGCVGFEGAGLILIFTSGWLWCLRNEFRFPRALLLIGGGVVVLWVVNAVRITALILIGTAGFPQVALNGFHSQAGWMAFNSVALGVALLSRRVGWLRRTPAEPVTLAGEQNPAARYLGPFLAILAAGMMARAASSGFEWLYPLRFIAAGCALWLYRKEYRSLDWRVGWEAMAVGVAVFGLWLGLDFGREGGGANAIGTGLAGLPDAARIGWLAVRTVAAVVTVPLAEELAFRGFLLRRLVKVDFEELGFRDYSWLSLTVSSLAFGAMHGERWLAGTVAGLLYAGVYLRRGRIGDAVAAHALTNGLLAAWVLTGSKWSLW